MYRGRKGKRKVVFRMFLSQLKRTPGSVETREVIDFQRCGFSRRAKWELSWHVICSISKFENPLGSRFSALKHVSFAILAQCELSSLRELWGAACCTYNTWICNYSEKNLEMRFSESDVLACVNIEVKPPLGMVSTFLYSCSFGSAWVFSLLVHLAAAIHEPRVLVPWRLYLKYVFSRPDTGVQK